MTNINFVNIQFIYKQFNEQNISSRFKIKFFHLILLHMTTINKKCKNNNYIYLAL